MIVPEHAGFGDSQEYETVPNIERLMPKPGTPDVVHFRYDYGADQARKYRGRVPVLKTKPAVRASFKSTGVFADGRRIELLPGGKAVAVSGPVRTVKEDHLLFEPVTEGEYSARQNSVFNAVTRDVKRQFAILPDIRPEGEYELPSYETSIDGLGTDITRIPADADFDVIDEPHKTTGKYIPIEVPLSGFGQDATTTAPAKKDFWGSAQEFVEKYGSKAAEAYKKYRGTKKGKALREDQVVTPVSRPATLPPPPPPPTTPWTPTTIAIVTGAGILAVGALVYFLTKK